MKCLKNAAVMCFVMCVSVIVTAVGCDKEETTPKDASQNPVKNPVVKPVAKYDTPAAVYNASLAAAAAGDYKTVIECGNPAGYDKSVHSILFIVCYAAGQEKLPPDRAKQLEEFLKTHGFNGLDDLKSPSGSPNEEFVAGLTAKIKDKKAFLIDHFTRDAAYRAKQGRAKRTAPTLEEVKITGDKAEGLAVHMKDGKLDYKRTVRFQLVDGSWRFKSIFLP